MDIRTFNAVGLILKRSDLNNKKKILWKIKGHPDNSFWYNFRLSAEKSNDVTI